MCISPIALSFKLEMFRDIRGFGNSENLVTSDQQENNIQNGAADEQKYYERLNESMDANVSCIHQEGNEEEGQRQTKGVQAVELESLQAFNWRSEVLERPEDVESQHVVPEKCHNKSDRHKKFGDPSDKTILRMQERVKQQSYRQRYYKHHEYATRKSANFVWHRVSIDCRTEEQSHDNLSCERRKLKFDSSTFCEENSLKYMKKRWKRWFSSQTLSLKVNLSFSSTSWKQYSVSS